MIVMIVPIGRKPGAWDSLRHPLVVTPAQAGVQFALKQESCNDDWIPACAGMTRMGREDACW